LADYRHHSLEPSRDKVRSKALRTLSERFAEAKIGSSGTDLPAFS
jgi:hypothetical protein